MPTKTLDKKTETTVQTLIKRGLAAGSISFDEINEALPSPGVDVLSAVLDLLEQAGVMVAESGEQVAYPQVTAPTPVSAKPLSGASERAGGSGSSVPVLEKIDDPVRMYLTQMGEIPLLTRPEEISLAKKIEVTRKRLPAAPARVRLRDRHDRHRHPHEGEAPRVNSPFDRTLKVNPSAEGRLEKERRDFSG